MRAPRGRMLHPGTGLPEVLLVAQPFKSRPQLALPMPVDLADNLLTPIHLTHRHSMAPTMGAGPSTMSRGGGAA
jgi:hypothetical protein